MAAFVLKEVVMYNVFIFISKFQREWVLYNCIHIVHVEVEAYAVIMAAILSQYSTTGFCKLTLTVDI
jgi:hypothetical protein